MDIRNVTQFSTFVSNNNLTSLDEIFRQIVICIADFSRQCNCRGRNQKAQTYQRCNSLYGQAVHLASGRFKNEFLSKTAERQIIFFSDNGEIIAIASR